VPSVCSSPSAPAVKPITFVEGCDFPRSSGSAELEQTRLTTVRQLRKRERKLLKRYRRAVSKGTPKEKRNALRAIQGSKAFLICAGIDANKSLRVRRRKSLAALMATASQLRWNSRSTEKAIITALPKKKGGVRTFWNFGIRSRTMQNAVCKLVSPYLVPQPHQYEYRSSSEGLRGVRAAIRRAKAAISEGNVWAATLDVRAFYPSFQAGQLGHMLPFLRKVICKFATADHYNAVLSKSTQQSADISHTMNADELLNQARLGGPQGSALSALLGGIIVSRLEWDSSVILINWVDDFILLGPSKESVKEAADALIAKVAALPGGHFSLKLRSLVHVEDYVLFLGHAIGHEDGIVQVTPAHADHLYERLEQIEEATCPYAFGNERHSPAAKEIVFKNIGDMFVVMKRWAEAFIECDDIEFHIEFVMQEIEVYRLAIGCSWDDLNAYDNQDLQSESWRYS
jgi:hypothetical protein